LKQPHVTRPHRKTILLAATLLSVGCLSSCGSRDGSAGITGASPTAEPRAGLAVTADQFEQNVGKISWYHGNAWVCYERSDTEQIPSAVAEFNAGHVKASCDSVYALARIYDTAESAHTAVADYYPKAVSDPKRVVSPSEAEDSWDSGTTVVCRYGNIVLQVQRAAAPSTLPECSAGLRNAMRVDSGSGS